MNYDDIINFPHHVSKTRKRMSLYERSAQFAPFDALEGYMDQVKEVSRITQKEKEISEETKIIINEYIYKLFLIYLKISFTFFHGTRIIINCKRR